MTAVSSFDIPKRRVLVVSRVQTSGTLNSPGSPSSSRISQLRRVVRIKWVRIKQIQSYMAIQTQLFVSKPTRIVIKKSFSAIK